VTVCVNDRKCVFGDVIDGEMVLNDAGKMVEFTWLDLPQHNENIELDEYIKSRTWNNNNRRGRFQTCPET